MRENVLDWLAFRWTNTRPGDSAKDWTAEPTFVEYDGRAWWLGTDGWSLIMFEAVEGYDAPVSCPVTTWFDRPRISEVFVTTVNHLAEFAGAPEWDSRAIEWGDYLSHTLDCVTIGNVRVDRPKVARILDGLRPGEVLEYVGVRHPDRDSRALLLWGDDWIAAVMGLLSTPSRATYEDPIERAA